MNVGTLLSVLKAANRYSEVVIVEHDGSIRPVENVGFSVTPRSSTVVLGPNLPVDGEVGE